MALSRVVSEILNVEICRDLETWVRVTQNRHGSIRHDLLLINFIHQAVDKYNETNTRK